MIAYTLTLLLMILAAGGIVVLASNVYHLRLSMQRMKRGKAGYIYAFMDVGQVLPVVKIGRAKDVEQRLAAHRTAAPFGLLVVCRFKVRDAVRAETMLHHRYHAYRVRKSGEWFWLTPHILLELVFLNSL